MTEVSSDWDEPLRQGSHPMVHHSLAGREGWIIGMTCLFFDHSFRAFEASGT